MTALPARQNNFDALRLVAAISVIFSHSFLIAEGTQNREWLILLTGNQCILGLTGVFIFFAISGFLVTQSFEQTPNPLHYLAKRALRIFPGLFIATLTSAFVLGPLVTTLPLGAYLSRLEPYEYVVGNTLLDQTVQQLPGISFADNPECCNSAFAAEEQLNCGCCQHLPLLFFAARSGKPLACAAIANLRKHDACAPNEPWPVFRRTSR